MESEENYPYRPGLEKVPAAVSSICFLDGDAGILEYRGYPIQELAARCTFEETACLILDGELPARAPLESFSAALRERRTPRAEIVDLMCRLPGTGHPMQALTASVAALGMFHAGAPFHDSRNPGFAGCRSEAALELIAVMPSLVAAWHRIRSGLPVPPPRSELTHAGHFLYQLTGDVPDPELARVFDACLVLHAEHEMNASTFAARVVGSALSDPYSVIASALATLRGPLHGGANERVLEMLKEIGSPEAVEGWVDRTLAAKGLIWGMGHREYRVKDPRAVILQGLNERVFHRLGRTPLYDTALRLEEVLARHPKFGAALDHRNQKFPNVDFYSGIIYEKMGIPGDLYTPIFAMSRVAGWLAHYFEQTRPGRNRIFRPKQNYDGARAKKVRPIDERS